MLQKLRPTADRLLVMRLDGEEKTHGGIIIPDAAKQKTQAGTVLATGPGQKDKDGKLIPMDIKVGDTVYFGKYAGTEVDDVRVILREDEILGIIEQQK
jgi:chaperonin GroES